MTPTMSNVACAICYPSLDVCADRDMGEGEREGEKLFTPYLVLLPQETVSQSKKSLLSC